MKRNQIKNYALGLLSVLAIASCSDLEIEQTDSVITDGFQGLADPESTVGDLYNNVFGNWGGQADRYALSEVTTDALLIPTRGADWGDNGRWRKLHQHEWGLEEIDIINPFNQWNSIQLTGSQILDPRSNASTEVAAQASFLRAFGMFNILDLYGQVPFRDTQLPSAALPVTYTGTEAVDFIISDLDNAIAGLPATGAGDIGNLIVASKAAARFLKAKVLLNKHIYANQLTGGGGTPDNADMQTVVDLVDAIEADGFALQVGYFDIFRETADNETIFWGNTSVGPRIFNTLHYNSTSLEGGGWNGFSTLAEYYDLFEGDSDANALDANGNLDNDQEERRGGVPLAGTPFTGRAGTTDLDGFEAGSNVGNGFLINQQYTLNGTALTDRQGAPLQFKRQFTDNDGNINLINNNEQTGIRVIKYNPTFGAQLNHQILFRYADAYLMKAEAMLRMGGDATSMVNNLRVLRDADPLGTVSEQDLLDERARELFIEGWRRNDMIRFGQYTRQWEFKSDSETGNQTRALFPIPLPQILANPNLVQNPGY
jgi:hypothetical protein